jgi:hypothetical protein
MTTDEKHSRIAAALAAMWRANRTTTRLADLVEQSGLTRDQLRSVAGPLTLEVGEDRIQVRYSRGRWSMAPAEGWPAYWARQPEAPF